MCVTSGSKKINKGDVIKINDYSISKNLFLRILNVRSIPNYLELDFKNFTIAFLWDTNFMNCYYPINTNYSNITRYYK